MTRTFNAADLVQLPVLNAEDAFALVSQLLQRARTHAPPASVSDALDDLAASEGSLREQLVLRHKSQRVDSVAAQSADRVIDNVWNALRDWLGAWKRIGEKAPRFMDVATLDAALFSEGLKFLTFRYHAEWTESETRLRLLSEPANVSLIHDLGGDAMLAHLNEAHAAYGAALRITVSPSADAEPAVKAAYEAALDAIRNYVIAVKATERRALPPTIERSEALLEPLTSWTTRPAPVPSDPLPSPPPPPANPTR